MDQQYSGDRQKVRPTRRARRRLGGLLALFAVGLAIMLLFIYYEVPPDPPVTGIFSYVTVTDMMLHPGLGSALAFGFTWIPPGAASPGCPSFSSCQWQWNPNTSWPLSFSIATCGIGTGCQAYVGIFPEASWWEFVNGTSLVPDNGTVVTWCSGGGQVCQPVSSIHQPDVSVGDHNIVVGVWDSPTSSVLTFNLTLSRYFEGYWSQ